MAVIRRAGAALLGALACAAGLATSACQPGRLDAIDLAQNDLSTDLVAHYTFDEGSGATVFDHSGNKRDGTIVDAGTWIGDGKFGGALHLDGTGYVNVPDFPDAPADFTVAGWIRTADLTSDAGVESFASTEYVFDAGWQMNLYKQTDGGRLQAAFWDRDAGTYTYLDCLCIKDQVWTHFAFVVDGTAHTLTIYADGHEYAVTAAPTPIAPGTTWLSIGAWSRPGRLLVGDVDDFVVYRRALVAAEIATLTERPPPEGM
jgi:hypothetical protein